MVARWEQSDARRVLRVPGPNDDKFSRGVVALRTGSVQYPGAAILGVEAAWRAGAGMVCWSGPEAVATLVLQRRPETLVHERRANAYVIGSGTDATHRADEERDHLQTYFAAEAPVIVDAGALDLVTPDHAAPLILTPHEGEFDRLCAARQLDRSGDRTTDALTVARTLRCVVVLKGAETVVADASGRVVVVSSGNGWLGTAGSGDVLAGALAAVVAGNSDDLLAAAATGVYLHQRAGMIASGSTGAAHTGHSIVAVEIAEALPEAAREVWSRVE